MKIEVSKTTRLLVMSRELELSAVFRHQLLETLESNNLAQCRVYGLGSRFDTQYFGCFVCQSLIQPDRCEGYCHGYSSWFVYTV
jgi:hypothetical protein